MKIQFTTAGFEDLAWWIENDRKTTVKIMKLIKEAARDPLVGQGQPERLVGRRAAYSRRISQKDRLVYDVTGDVLSVVSCRFHYDDH